MGAVIIIFEFLILAAVCIYLLHVFTSFKRTPWYALLSTWLGWLLCFSIVFLIPIDIINMDYDACKVEAAKALIPPEDYNGTEPFIPEIIHCHRPPTSLDDKYMEKQWAALWWGTMILSWLGFPILSSFFQASHFTVWERVVRAIKENIVLYCVLGTVGVIALFVLWLRVRSELTGDKFLALLLSLANAYGLILTVILMSYGLVDIPRYLWRKANRTSTLRYYSVMAFKYKEAIEHAKDDLLQTLKTVKTIADKVHDHDPYRIYVDVILAKCPPEYDEVAAEGDVELSYSKLVSIHQKVRENTHNMTRAVCLYEQMLKKAFKTEDVLRTRTHPQSDLKIYWSFIPPRTHRFTKIVDALEYVWQVYLFTSILRVFAVFFAGLSILIVWSEITLTSQTHNLSPFYHMISGMHLEGLAKQLFCLIIIFYMALCAYTTLFKLKIFNFYRLVPHQMSDAGSIMFSSNYLCRLAAPLAYNFLQIVHVKDTNFEFVMGDMTTTGLGRDFMIGFPILVVVLCLLTIFNVYSKIGAMCCIKRLRYRPDDDELLADEGEKILTEEREAKEGRGALKMTTKQAIRSTIRKEVKDITKHDHEAHEAHEAPQIEEPAAAPAQDEPVTLYSAMANKYGIRPSSNELLPPTSRFAKRGSISSESYTPSSTGGMKQNLSANDLAAAEAGTSKSGIRGNLSSNNLASQTPPAPTSTFGKFFSSSASQSTLPPPIAPTTTASPSTRFPSSPLPPPPSSSSSVPSRAKSPTELLPPTSRFARQQQSPAPAPAAILTNSSSSSLSDSSSSSSTTSSRDTRSLLGGLFNKPKFELLPNKSPNQDR